MQDTKTLPMVESQGIKPICHVPWQQMVIDSNGVVVPCCYWAAYENSNPPVGNINDNTIAEIWNGERFQQLRRHMAAGNLKAAGCAKCYALKQKLDMALVHDPDALKEADRPEAEQTPYFQNLTTLRQEVAAGATKLKAKPTVISMTPSHRCNIRCTHCYQEATRTLDLKRDDATDELMTLCGTLVRLIAGGGEPFLLPIWRRFLKEFDHSRNPYLDFATTTNATIVTPEVEAGLRKFKTLTLNVSLDGTGQAYERVRVGAKWSEVAANLRKLRQLARQAPSRHSVIGMSMCVMKSNIKDLPNLVRFSSQEEIPFGMSPVVTMPPDESLACFNDPARETAGWRAAYEEARRMIRDEHGPMLARLWKKPCHGTVKSLVSYVDMLEEATPWQMLSQPHHRVRIELSRDVVARFAECFEATDDKYVYIYPLENSGLAPYYATLKDSSAASPLTVLGSQDDCGQDNVPARLHDPLGAGPFHFDVSLPEGRYLIGLSTKWVLPGSVPHLPGRDPELRFDVICNKGQARVANELWKANWTYRGLMYLHHAVNSMLWKPNRWQRGLIHMGRLTKTIRKRLAKLRRSA